MPKISDNALLQILDGRDPSSVYLPLADTSESPSTSRKTSIRALPDIISDIHDMGVQGGAVTIDFAAGSHGNKKIELNANTTFTFSNGSIGRMYVVSIKTNGYTVTWPANIAFFEGEPAFNDDDLYQPVIVYFQG